MNKSVESLRTELTRIRTGRANPDLLDHIKVEYYGSEVALNNVASISVEDSRTLVVSVWEKDMVSVAEKAIMISDLGLTPNSAGTVIRIPLPALTEERRKELIKVARREAENTRIAIRNIRRDANGAFKDMVKKKAISEDDERRAVEHVQKLTDEHIAKVDEIVTAKERDLLEI